MPARENSAADACEPSVERLFEFARSIKSRQMLTNSTLTPQSLSKLVRDDGASIVIGGSSAIVLVPDEEGVNHVTFYAKGREALNEAAGLIPEDGNRCVCDLVGRPNKLEPTVSAMRDAGFTCYAVFQRMLCREIALRGDVDYSEVELATEQDAPAILSIIRDEFDPLTAHMPTTETLLDRIAHQEVLVVRRDGDIAGFTVFKSRGLKMALLDYVVVGAPYRKEGLGRKMLQFKWARMNESDSYYLWVNRDFAGPVRYHEKNGFVADGVLDYIMLPPRGRGE